MVGTMTLENVLQIIRNKILVFDDKGAKPSQALIVRHSMASTCGFQHQCDPLLNRSRLPFIDVGLLVGIHATLQPSLFGGV